MSKVFSTPHSILNITDTGAVAFYLLLLSKTEESRVVTHKEVTDTFKMGRSAFYRARSYLLDNNLITEIKRHDAKGHFAEVEYALVPHETADQKSEHGDPPQDRNCDAVGLAQVLICKNNSSKSNSSQNNSGKNKSSILNNSNNNVGEKKFRRSSEYPDDFERLWKSFSSTLGAVGSKQEAFKEFKKLHMDPDDVTWLIGRIRGEIRRKTELRKAGQFDPNFQHVCRILKYRAWEGWSDDAPKTQEFIL